jgi:hypothetical protein
MRNISVQGISQDYAAFSFAKGWGFEVNRLDLGDIPRTTLSDPDGSGGSTSFNDLAVGLGGGLTLRPGLSVGAGLKLIRESIDGTSTKGYALDAGVLCDVPKMPGLRVGAAFQNLGPAVRFNHEKESLPAIARAGALYAFKPWGQESRVTMDLMKKSKQEMLWAAGLETTVKGVAPLRLGYNRRQDAGSGLTMGLGWRYKALQLDYAFEMEGTLGDSHRWSLTWRWGNAVRQ